MKIETQLRAAIRDCVNQDSRKPFFWGGLKGYQQLEGIAEGLHQAEGTSVENEFLQRLILQVDRTLTQNQTLAAELEEAHVWLCKVATCLRYPPNSYSEIEWQKLNSQQVTDDMEDLLKQLRLESENKSILSRFCNALSKRWKDYGPELLHCYDLSGLPPDNLQLEGFFNHLRCHQRRISGRKSTKELRNFGQFQALFLADTQTDLLEQIRHVPVEKYQECRQRLIESESPRRFIHQLHRNPKKTIHCLLDKYMEHQRKLELIPQLAYPLPSLYNT